MKTTAQEYNNQRQRKDLMIIKIKFSIQIVCFVLPLALSIGSTYAEPIEPVLNKSEVSKLVNEINERKKNECLVNDLGPATFDWTVS